MKRFRRLNNWFKNTFTVRWIAIAIFDEKSWQHDPALYDHAITMRRFNEQSPYRNYTPRQFAHLITKSLIGERSAIRNLGISMSEAAIATGKLVAQLSAKRHRGFRASAVRLLWGVLI